MLTVSVLDKRLIHYKSRSLKLSRWLMKDLKQADLYLEIFIVGNKLMPKNVLSFPADQKFPRPDLKQKPLGEIYLNPSYIKQQGEDFDYMLIHGFLHLLGYDHIRKSDRIVMEQKEIELLGQYKK